MIALAFAPIRRPWRLAAATAAVALAGSFALTAGAAPPGPPPGAAMAPMGPLGGPGPRFDRLLDAANATAEQRSQIKSILDAAHADLKAMREAAAPLHEQGVQIFTATTVDANAAEALRQQMLARHDQASKRMLQAMLDVSRVLSPEQRQQIADAMAQRRAAMRQRWDGAAPASR